MDLQMKDSLVQELQQKAEKTELLQVELQMLETERVRLSLVEEKLVDILQLLQQLRDLVSQSRGQRSTCSVHAHFGDGSSTGQKVLGSRNVKVLAAFQRNLWSSCH